MVACPPPPSPVGACPSWKLRLGRLCPSGMLTGSVVGDGELTAFEQLLAERGGQLLFEGSLVREHAHGESVMAMSIRLSADTMEAPSEVEDIRRESGWVSELVTCFSATISVASLGRHELPVLAALDVDPSDALRLLILSPRAPLLGRIVCQLLPKEDIPFLEGTASGSPAYGDKSSLRFADAPMECEGIGGALASMEAALCNDDGQDLENCLLNKRVEHSDCPVKSAFQLCEEEECILASERAALISAAVEAAAQDTQAVGGYFHGHFVHPLLGSLQMSLALVEKLQSTPMAASLVPNWPHAPSQDEEVLTDEVTWWRGRWCIKEMLMINEIFVGFCGMSLMLINPVNSQCNVGIYKRVRGR
ncbi:MAG: hypothetical protein SGPRY_003090 [Prymnesium sp.]